LLSGKKIGRCRSMQRSNWSQKKKGGMGPCDAEAKAGEANNADSGNMPKRSKKKTTEDEERMHKIASNRYLARKRHAL